MPLTGMYVLQGVVPAEIAAAPFDVKVIDIYSETGTRFSAAEVDAMGGGPGGGLLLGYFSIGEAEVYRDYFSTIPQSAIGPENPDWDGNYEVAYWTQQWRDVATAYLDRMLEAGYDGIYFDVVDEYQLPWAQQNAPGGDAEGAMVDLVKYLADYARARDPDFKVWANNAEELLENATYLQTIDGMFKENLFYKDNGNVQPASETTYSLGLLDLMLDAGKDVVSIEYVSGAAKIADVQAKAAAAGIAAYVAKLDLNGVNYAGVLPGQVIQEDSGTPGGGNPPSGGTGTGGGIVLDSTPDSLFGWSFKANTGDTYGGHFFDDSKDYAAAQSWTTAYGRYTVTSETEFGYDVTSTMGFSEGQTFTTWYRDIESGRALTTQSNGAYATGSGGPGSEYDYAWTGSAWDDFGANGYHLATGELPDSFFAWRFVADSGDTYGGHFFDDSRDYAVGSRWTGSEGRYEILQEYEYGFDIGVPYGIAEGATFTTWYSDADTGQAFSTASGGRYATSSTGPGTEYDQAWTGSSWDDFGYGGYHQAGGDLPDSYFAWRFVANSGDVFGGHFFDDSRDYAAGSSWTTAYGRYEVFQEYEYGFDIGAAYGIAEGATYTTWYRDSVLGMAPRTYSEGAYATGSSGPGSEYDYAFTAVGWDEFGAGGYHQVGATG